MLKLLGSEKISDWNHNPDWIMGTCVFAPYQGHKGRKDNRPSFGVKVDKISGYHCFACGRKGRLSMLPSYLEMISGRDLKSIRQFVMEHEHLGLEEYEMEEEEADVHIMPEGVMNRFVRLQSRGLIGLNYLQSRGMTKESIVRFGLKYDPTKNRIIFPVRNPAGDLIGVRGRTTQKEVEPKYLSYKDMMTGPEPKRCGYWFGMQFQPSPGKLLILVEGELDAIMTRQALGKGTVWAAQGASIPKRQVETIRSMTTNPILILFDNDQAGHDAAERLAQEIRGFVPRIFMVKNYRGKNDPADMARDGVLLKALRSMEES